LNSYSIFEKRPIEKIIFKMLGINPGELTTRNSKEDRRVEKVIGHTGDLNLE